MNFDELLKSLHQDYLNSLPRKISVIEDALKAGDVATLRECFHKLKGTGRTYGMPEVSELSAVVEALCQQQAAQALMAGAQGLAILRDVHAARLAGHEFRLDADARFAALQKLLQN